SKPVDVTKSHSWVPTRSYWRLRSSLMSLTVMETIDVMENNRLSSEEVVDLTCEGSEPADVDLTNNDSAVLVDEGTQSRAGQEDTNLSSLHASSTARSKPGMVSCPVSMDAYAEIIDSGWLMVSVYQCSQCICDSLNRTHTCSKLGLMNCEPCYKQYPLSSE
uniref:Uncharacterized protein n=1 Tax=Electrophorus electricus TaxID=8005 RepID=A0A4W4HEW2_ELEEL